MREKKSALSKVTIIAVLLLLSGCSGKKVTSTDGTAGPASGAPGGKTVDDETAGEISGSVMLHGTPAPGKPMYIAAMISCSKGTVAPSTNNEVVTGDGGTLANVFVYVKSGLESYSFPEPSETVEFDQKGCQFSPHVIALQVRQKLEVTNSDSTSHNIHPLSKNNRQWNESQAPGQPPIVKSFARPEIPIKVKCNIHPWMNAYIAVSPTPYFQVTGVDGSFTLKNVPPGTYMLAAWHERYGTSEQTVTVASKESKKVAFTFEAETGGAK